VLATPTTTNLVETLQGGLPLTVDAEGVHIGGEVRQDSEREKWGVCTRLRENYRSITMIAARHGRSIEGITRLLTISRQLAGLTRRMGRADDFPDEFQILFRMPAINTTTEGPSLRDATIAEVYVDGKRIDQPL
jgi:hypothetical protein